MNSNEYNLRSLKEIAFNRLEDIKEFIEYTREINTIAETKFSREWWVISAYAHFKMIVDCYLFPLSTRREIGPKPDFWISFNDNANIIGIETTFCSEEKYEQAKKICADRNDGSYPINTAFMRDNTGNFTESSFQLPNDPLHGMPIYGNYSTIYTVERITKSIKKKIATYDNFKNKYILTVYINLPSNIYIDNADKNEICQSLSLHKEWFNTFLSIEIIWSKDNVMQLMTKEEFN